VISTNWGSATDVGLVREHNEDAFFAQFPVFVVADGMGGRAAGEVASGLTSKRFRELASGGPITVDEVNRALVDANGLVHDHSGTAAQLDGMGTTAVGLVHVTDKLQDLWLVFNVGDSRLYRLYQGTLEQVTTDHTEVQEMIDLGSISPDEAKVHPLRHVITRAVGTDDLVDPDIWLLTPVPGERFLLCSDGLTGEVTDAAIAEVLASEGDPALAAVRLVEKAVASGGHDNVTVVVVDVFADDQEDLRDTAPGRSVDRSDALIAVPFDREETAESAELPVIVDVPTSVGRPEAGPRPDGRVQMMIDAVPELDTTGGGLEEPGAVLDEIDVASTDDEMPVTAAGGSSDGG
jgi:serine/threonine protein phosphatase PrpC